MNEMTTGIKRGRKFEQVLEGARQVFMADGFEGASVDNIARAANVSKATLYSYFPDKKLLFSEVARSECARQAEVAITNIDMDSNAPEVLKAAATHMLQFFMSPFGQRMFRICVAESDRFPELGREFYESGPRIVKDTLVHYFDMAISKGDLMIQDKDLAAYQFVELCKADIFLKIVFKVQTEYSQKEIDRVIAGAVDMFMARYGAKP